MTQDGTQDGRQDRTGTRMAEWTDERGGAGGAYQPPWSASESLHETWALGTYPVEELRVCVDALAREYRRAGQAPEALLRTLKALMPVAVDGTAAASSSVAWWDEPPAELRGRLIALAVATYYS